MSEPIDDGGPAFPTKGSAFEIPGLTKREYFAAKAMAALIGLNIAVPQTVIIAYDYADAMIAESEKSTASVDNQ